MTFVYMAEISKSKRASVSRNKSTRDSAFQMTHATFLLWNQHPTSCFAVTSIFDRIGKIHLRPRIYLLPAAIVYFFAPHRQMPAYGHLCERRRQKKIPFPVHNLQLQRATTAEVRVTYLWLPIHQLILPTLHTCPPPACPPPAPSSLSPAPLVVLLLKVMGLSPPRAAPPCSSRRRRCCPRQCLLVRGQQKRPTTRRLLRLGHPFPHCSVLPVLWKFRICRTSAALMSWETLVPLLSHPLLL